MTEQTSNWGCSRCGVVMHDYADVAYDGPADPTNTECSPFGDWQVLCHNCYGKDTELQREVELVSWRQDG